MDISNVPRLQHDDERVASFMQRGLPCVLMDCPLVGGLKHWTTAHLHEHSVSDEHWPVNYTPRTIKQVWRIYAARGLGEGGVREMPFNEFATVSSEPCREQNYYCQALLLWSKAGLVDTPKRRSSPLTSQMHKRRLGPLLDVELKRGVDMEWLASACEEIAAMENESCNDDVATRSYVFEACQLWCSHGDGVTTPLHYDTSDNFLAQIEGGKELTLFPPSASFDLYPFPLGHPMDTFSMVDTVAPEAAREVFPAHRAAAGIRAVLGAGDVLWLPKFWWHRVAQPAADAPNLSINTWLCATGRKPAWHEVLSTRGISQPRATEAFWVGKDKGAAVAEEVRVLLDMPSDVVAAIGGDSDDDANNEVCGQLPDGLLGLHYLQAARMAECAATIVCDSSVLGGRFLAAVAEDVDRSWPAGGAAAGFARKLRKELAAAMQIDDMVDDAPTTPNVCRVLLRLITRHGRLAPGIAAAIDGPITSCQPLPPRQVLLGFYAKDSSRRLERPPVDDALSATAVSAGGRPADENEVFVD